MEKEGFTIKGISFDLGNNTLTKELNYQQHHYFDNPFDPSRKVFMFPDAPHLLKLVRNNLFDYGFKVPSRNCIGQCFEDDNSNLPNSTSTDTTSDDTANDPEISSASIPVDETIPCTCSVPLVKGDIEDVLLQNRGTSDLRTAFNLSRAHLDVKGSGRQRVRIAAQTLSRTIAKSLLQFDPESNVYQSKHDAVLLINDWFDTMNSRKLYDQNQLCCGMAPDMHGKSQLEILDRMENFLDNFHVMDTEEKGYRQKAKMPWQYGLMCSVRATRSLYKELVVNGPFTFLLTTKLNQDCIENLFSRLRALGGDNVHPTPLEAMRRMRILLLVKGADLLIRCPAVEMEDDNGDPVSDEDIAEQEQSLKVEQLKETEILNEQERQQDLEKEEVSSQIVTEESHQAVANDYIRDKEESENISNVFEIDLARMEAEELEEEKQLEALENQKKLEKEQQFTTTSQLIFADVFFHQSATDVTINEFNDHQNMDMVQFQTPVIVEEIRIIPNEKKVYIPNFKNDRILYGRTRPQKFDIDIFCNNVEGIATDAAMEKLGTMSYDESQQISLCFDNNKMISSNLVVIGKYINMSLMVYGRTEKKSNQECQGLGYFAGFIACKDIKGNDKKVAAKQRKDEANARDEEGTERKDEENSRKRKHIEIEPKVFVPHGRKSGELTATEANDSLTPWVYNISRGGLTVAYKDFYLDAELFEKEFNDFHGPFTRPISEVFWLHGPEEEAKRLSKEKRHFPFKTGTRIIDDFTNVLVSKFGEKSDWVEKYERNILSSFSSSRLNIRIKAEKIKLCEENVARLEANKKRRLASKEKQELAKLVSSDGNDGSAKKKVPAKKKPKEVKKKPLGVKKKPLKAKKKKSVREHKQIAQLSNGDGRARKQLGQFLN